MRCSMPGLLSGLLALQTAAPAVAMEVSHRFSLQADVGLNAVLPLAEGQIAYRLPALDNRLEVFAAYQPWAPSLATASLSLVSLGARYYWGGDDIWRPFALAAVGDAMSSTSGAGSNVPAGMAGLGLDWMPMLGLTGNVTVGFPMLLRPEIGVRLAI